MPHPAPKLLVFDLDGTLIDSRADLCNSVNATLAHLGKPNLPEQVIASYIGDGASMLIRRALGDPEGSASEEALVTEALDHFLDYYRVHKLDFTYVYPGVLEALAGIRAAAPQVSMAVLTNKPVNPSREICAYLGLEQYFARTMEATASTQKSLTHTGCRHSSLKRQPSAATTSRLPRLS